MADLGTNAPFEHKPRSLAVFRPGENAKVLVLAHEREDRPQRFLSFRWSALVFVYVGKLTFGVTESTLEQVFAAHGNVQSAQVIMDRDTGRSKGFGFVEMGSDQEAQTAIAALNGKDVDGRPLTVNEAFRPDGLP